MQLTPSNAAICSSSTRRSTISSLEGAGGGGVPGARGSGGGLLYANERCSWKRVAPLARSSGDTSPSRVRTTAPSGKVGPEAGWRPAWPRALAGLPTPPNPSPTAPAPNARIASRRPIALARFVITLSPG